MSARSDRFTAAFPRPDNAKQLMRWTIYLASIVGSLAGAARWVNSHPTKAESDSLFVRRDTFALYRVEQAGMRREDSLSRSADREKILNAIQGVDSSLKCLRKVPGFCR